MSNPKATFALALAGVATGAVLLGASLSGALGPDDGRPASIGGVVGLFVFLIAGYLAVVRGLAVWRAARLQDAGNIVARWDVPPETWRQFCDIGVAETGVDVPGLGGLIFYPRRKDGPEPVEVICGKRDVQIDGRYYGVSPGRGAGMEEAGMTRTQPPCLALVIARAADGHRAPRVSRSLLLLPIPHGAEAAAHKALRHYTEAVESVRDLGDIARASPLAAKLLFWGVLGASMVAGGTGFWLEANDYPGSLPGVLGITGIMVALGTLVLGFAFRPRRG